MRIEVFLVKMAAPMEHMEVESEQIHFPLRSGACLVNTYPVFSHDNKFLLVCSNAVIKVYSTQSGDCVRELWGHKAEITGLGLHPSNKLQLISCSLDKKLIVWDYSDGVLLKEISLQGPLNGIYTTEGQSCVFVLQQVDSAGSCDLISVSLSKREKYKTKCVMPSCTKDARQSSVGVKGRFAATVKNRHLKIKDIKANGPVVKHLIDRGMRFTCAACHPTTECVATGCADGKIYLWYKFQSPASAVKNTLHWHSVAVRDLCFSLEGTFLLSGGYECTLVKWHLDSRSREFLPRLGAPINHIACSSDNQLYATCHDENVIQVISNTFTIQQVYQGLSHSHLSSARPSVEAPLPAGLLRDPRTSALVMNGKPGHLQFFSVHEDKQLYNLDIVGHNYISPENLNRPLTVTEVVGADFDSMGSWLATAEYWSERKFSPEIRLKFWRFIEEKQSFELNTVVEMAHDERIVCLRMRPGCDSASQGLGHMAVTTSTDGKFKLWTLVDDTDIYRANMKWTCGSVGFYRNLPAGEAAFSEDGSLLAVVFTDYITLWDPESNLHKETLCHGNNDHVKHVLFGLDGCSQYLVSSTTNSLLTVWDLITCSVLWSVNVKLACITRDPCTDLMAAITNSRDLFVFRPSSPEPVFSHPAVSSTNVLSAVFIPHGQGALYSKTPLAWQSRSELYFVNDRQELQCVALDSEDSRSKNKQDVVEFEQNLPQTVLSQIMMGHTNRSQRLEVKQTQVAQQPDLKFIREIFGSASHVQPPVTGLCKAFVQSLMIRKVAASQHSQHSDTEEDSEEEMALEPDSGVVMDTDSADDQSISLDVQTQSQSSSEKSETQSSQDSGIDRSRLDSNKQSRTSKTSSSKRRDSLSETGALENLTIDLDWYSKPVTT